MRTDTGEMRAAAVCLALVAAYMAAVLASGLVPTDEFRVLFTVYIQTMTALTMIVGGIVLLAVCWVQRNAHGSLPPPLPVVRNFLADRWQRDRLLSVLAPPLACAMALASFNGFKQLILPSAGFGLDPLFAEWDRMLFLGVDPWLVTHKLFGSLAATRLIDGFYHAWFLPMTLGIAVAVFTRDPELRIQYLLAYLLSFIIIGSLLAYWLPSAGPCYYERFAGPSETFAALMARLNGHDVALVASGEGGLAALRNQAALLNHFNSGELAFGGGISAMPSVHNALAILFALGGMRLNRKIGYAMWAYAGVIWVGSIHLGWHYALDGLVAGLAVIVIWIASGHAARLLLDSQPAFEPHRLPAE